jgi:uncharacterized protein (DUF486 family)
MALAGFGYLKFKELEWFENAGLITFVLISWDIAFFEYCLQVPPTSWATKAMVDGLFYSN